MTVRKLFLTLGVLLTSSQGYAAPTDVWLDFEAFDIGEVYYSTSLSRELPANAGAENYVIFSSFGFGSFLAGPFRPLIEITSGGPFGSGRSICPRPSSLAGEPVNCAGAMNLLFSAPGATAISFDVAADDVTEEIGVITILGPAFSDLAYGGFTLDGLPLTFETISLASLSFNTSPDGSGAPVTITDATPLMGLAINSAVDPAGLLYDNIRFTLPAASVPEPATVALLGAALAGLGIPRHRKPH